MSSSSYLAQLSSALVQTRQQASAADAAVAPLSNSFPPPPPVAPAPVISAANPFTFLPRAAPVAAAVAPPPLPSFNAEFTRITLEKKAAEAAREVAALQAARKAAAAQADEASARARAAKRLLAQARPASAGASSARPIELDSTSSSAFAAAARGELLSELELRDAADPNPEDDPNAAPIPSSFDARRIRDPKTGMLPPRKSDWSLRQTLMSKRPAAASSSAQSSRAPAAAASVGSKTVTQSRWVAKGMQADEAQAAARKKVRAEAAMKQASVIVGNQRAGIKPAAAAAASSSAASGSLASSAAARSSSAASPPIPKSAASQLKRKAHVADDDGVEEVIDLRGESKSKKPKVKASPAAAASASVAAVSKGKATPAAASSSSASKSATPLARSTMPKKQITGSGFTASFTAVPAAAAAAAAATPPVSAAVTIPVIPLPRTSLCAIPVSVRQPFVDAMFPLCCTHHPTQFDREEMHPSLPSNALLLRLEFEMLQKTIRVHPTDAPGTTAAIAAAAGEAQLRTYRESTAIVLQLMRDEKDLVAVSRIVAQS